MKLKEIYDKQVEAWKERFQIDDTGQIIVWDRTLPDGDWDNQLATGQDLLSSRHKDTIELLEAIIKEVEGNVHYWRECHNCGLAKGGYLHCVHDKVQKLCHGCGERMPSVDGDCECEFIVEVDDLLTTLQAELTLLKNER